MLAYVSLRPGADADADDLIAHCRSLIAGYKKPKYVRFMDILPRNSVGKIAKAELHTKAQAELKQEDEKRRIISH